MVPIKTDYCNFTFTAPPSMDNCGDLHVYKGDDFIMSTWVFTSWWKRIKFLFTGKLDLFIFGQGMPPVALDIHVKPTKTKEK